MKIEKQIKEIFKGKNISTKILLVAGACIFLALLWKIILIVGICILFYGFYILYKENKEKEK